jgi:hypothetical protein
MSRHYYSMTFAGGRTITNHALGHPWMARFPCVHNDRPLTTNQYRRSTFEEVQSAGALYSVLAMVETLPASLGLSRIASTPFPGAQRPTAWCARS